MIPELLTTILFGNSPPGQDRKEIMFPYSGSSSRFFEHARDLSIQPFVMPDDLSAFRIELGAAAHAFSSYLETKGDVIAETVADETGSPISYQHEDREGARMFLSKLPHLHALLPRKYVSDPKGNVLLILSANEPIIVTTILVFTALYDGNSVYIKSSTKSPTYGYLLARELAKNPALKNRVHYLLVDREETGRLIRAKSFDYVLSLGSSATNKKLMTMCIESDTDFSPENEGNDWCYIDSGGDSLKKMSKIIAESFTRHNGQMCNADRGVMVHTEKYDAFVADLKDRIHTFRVGSPRLKSSDIGALIQGTADNADILVRDSAERGAEVWNYARKDTVMSPTLILNPDENSSILSETVFAPVLWVKKIKDHEDAISLYEKRNLHGLGFSIFTNDEDVVKEFVTRLRVGRININKHPLKTGLFDPLGGIFLSGRGGPSHWIERLSNRKFINGSFAHGKR